MKLTEDKQEDLAGKEVRGKKKGKLAIRFDDALFSHEKKGFYFILLCFDSTKSHYVKSTKTKGFVGYYVGKNKWLGSF